MRNICHALALIGRVVPARTRPDHQHARQVIPRAQGKSIAVPAEAGGRLVQIDLAAMRPQLHERQVVGGHDLGQILSTTLAYSRVPLGTVLVERHPRRADVQMELIHGQIEHTSGSGDKGTLAREASQSDLLRVLAPMGDW